MTIQSSPACASTARPLESKPDVSAHTVRDTVHDHAPFEPFALIRIGIGVVAAALVWFRVYEPFSQISVIGLMALGFVGWPIVKEALQNLLALRMTMELSMTIAILAATAIGEVFTALVIALFVLVAEELEHLTIARGRLAIRSLVEFIPQEARVRRDGAIVSLALGDIHQGDHVFVSPGEKIPVDGQVIEGHSYVDQSRITGESMPAEKKSGEAVFAGSINQMGALEICAERVGRDTSYGRIIDAVEQAEHSRAPVQKLADRLAGYLVYVAFAAAIITWFLTQDIRDTISVIIVAGACGIAAGTPLAILGGIGQAANLGSIIKGGIHLETLGRIDTVILDKTGTLTTGEPVVTQIIPAPGIESERLLRFAAAAELHSEHPLAQAVVREARRLSYAIPEPDTFHYTVARGITARIEGQTVLVGNRKLLKEAGIDAPDRSGSSIGSDLGVAVEGQFLGDIIVADAIRPQAHAALAALRDLKVRTVLLSGDVASVATHVGQQLGLDEIRGDMLPEDKLRYVHELLAQKHIVAMVGDGVNDAPALTAANVGIAMGSGTDIAQESADIVLIGNDLAKLVETLRIARKTRRIIWQNFAGTLGIDAFGILLAALGFLNPLLAAFIHVGSELAFLANSSRLYLGKPSSSRGVHI